MRTFTVQCQNDECPVMLDIEISEADLLDADLTHAVVCVDCGIESEFEYDAETQDLIPVVDDEDEDEDDEPETDDAAEEGEDE